MKRLICLLLALTMLVSLSACGQSKEEKALSLAREIYEELKLVDADLVPILYDLSMGLMAGGGSDYQTVPTSELDTLLLTDEEISAGLAGFYDLLSEKDSPLVKNCATKEECEKLILYAAEQTTENTYPVYCTIILWAYLENGKIEEANSLLAKANESLEELKNIDTNGNYYPFLNDYYSSIYGMLSSSVLSVYNVNENGGTRYGSDWPVTFFTVGENIKDIYGGPDPGITSISDYEEEAQKILYGEG